MRQVSVQRGSGLAAALFAVIAAAAVWASVRLGELDPRSGEWSAVYAGLGVAAAVVGVAGCCGAFRRRRGAGMVLLIGVAVVALVAWLAVIVSWTRPAPYTEPLRTRRLALVAGNAAALSSAVSTRRAMRRAGIASGLAALVAAPIACVSLALMAIAWDNPSD